MLCEKEGCKYMISDWQIDENAGSFVSRGILFH